MLKRRTHIKFGKYDDHSIDYLAGILEDARTITLKMVDGLSVKQLDWQYAKGWNSIGALLSHISAVENVFAVYWLEGRDLTKKEDKKWTPGMFLGKHLPKLIKGEPLEYYTRQLEASRRKLLQQIKKLDTERFHKVEKNKVYKYKCNLAWILYHLAEDEVHHRGQISIIKKLYKARKKK